MDPISAAITGLSRLRVGGSPALDSRQTKDYPVDPLAMTERCWPRAGELDGDSDTVAATMNRAEPA